MLDAALAAQSSAMNAISEPPSEPGEAATSLLPRVKAIEQHLCTLTEHVTKLAQTVVHPSSAEFSATASPPVCSTRKGL
jgi:hypothetical protein